MTDDGGRDPRKTRWSLVVAAGRGDRKAFGELYSIYWEPLYWSAMCTVRSHDSARDIVQDFQAWMLEKDFLATADNERGSFRGYLFTAFKGYMSNDYRRRMAEKRSGHHTRVDFGDIEKTYALSGEEQDPDRAFDRQWAKVIVRNAWSNYEQRYVLPGQSSHYEIEKRCLFREVPQDEAATALSVDIGALRTRLTRMRERFRQSLREVVGETIDVNDLEREFVGDAEAFRRRFDERVSMEIQYLLECLAQTPDSGVN